MENPPFFGLQKTSLIDFPDEVAAIIFFSGCNLRCPYCHNPRLVLNQKNEESLTYNQILQFVEKRAPLLGGVVLSGGEPLLYKGIFDFIEKLKKGGVKKIKLDTNGLLPQKLKELKDIDYIALDLKALPSQYPLLGGKKNEGDRVIESLKLLKDGAIPFEIRTTLLPSLLPLSEVREFSSYLQGVDSFYITGFRGGNCLNPHYNHFEDVTLKTLKLYQKEFEKFNIKAQIRF